MIKRCDSIFGLARARSSYAITRSNGWRCCQHQQPKDRTRVELVNLPIDSAGRPNIHQEPQGRFVAYVPGFLDPITYGEGRLLTLYGTTAPSEQGKVGDYEHTYPVMNAQGYHLWRVEERVEVDDIGPYMFPCRGFYCWPRTMPERDGKIIQEVK